jgi:hypothetical protein
LKSPERRRSLLRLALEKRLRDVCRSIRQLRPNGFGEHAPFVSELQAQASSTSFTHTRLPQSAASGWSACDEDYLEALRALALGKGLSTRSSDAPPIEPFLASLYEARRDRAERLRLLIERYSCPLNIVADSEAEVREHLLERLMVQDRAQVESGAIELTGERDALLKLNLLAVYAAHAWDLRYLDALNYYYELLTERGEHENHWSVLFISYLGLYARALNTWLNQQLSE